MRTTRTLPNNTHLPWEQRRMVCFVACIPVLHVSLRTFLLRAPRSPPARFLLPRTLEPPSPATTFFLGVNAGQSEQRDFAFGEPAATRDLNLPHEFVLLLPKPRRVPRVNEQVRFQAEFTAVDHIVDARRVPVQLRITQAHPHRQRAGVTCNTELQQRTHGRVEAYIHPHDD